MSCRDLLSSEGRRWDCDMVGAAACRGKLMTTSGACFGCAATTGAECVQPCNSLQSLHSAQGSMLPPCLNQKVCKLQCLGQCPAARSLSLIHKGTGTHASSTLFLSLLCSVSLDHTLSNLCTSHLVVGVPAVCSSRLWLCSHAGDAAGAHVYQPVSMLSQHVRVGAHDACLSSQQGATDGALCDPSRNMCIHSSQYIIQQVNIRILHTRLCLSFANGTPGCRTGKSTAYSL